MQNAGRYRKGSRSFGAMMQEFFAWLRGFRSPQYVPQKSRYGDGGRTITVRKSDFESQSDEEERWNDDVGVCRSS
jgi:hypothetical protein